ncbi:hypothetical protein AC11_2305 [Escherichia coli 6-537-08_S3_C1]|nr:hypothetical protein ECBCE002MS12_1980 [Escherichia coli BCE002_MS12]EMX89532.1 hypothetical protein ECBCE001MS16_2055 [Escherichia coli BCE001_MS16]KEM76155.1 hypothetical protein AC11_2305 [Escherichia coli 6-537-08_S3_C1]KEM83038.1 hypothetical protein AC64_2309 [Escherichia coli 6-537-08_S3_C3]KEN17387.1 hypothetical protein AC39_2394 [Escherichia coli 6-537-08_S3_C2]
MSFDVIMRAKVMSCLIMKIQRAEILIPAHEYSNNIIYSVVL